MKRTGHTRSILKALSWRVTASTDTALIVLVVAYIAGQPLVEALIMGLSVGGLEVVTKIFLYYFHERIWNRIGEKDV